jgi:hypothetical protein
MSNSGGELLLMGYRSVSPIRSSFCDDDMSPFLLKIIRI